MILIKDKRGSHVGVVLSFVIFVTFLIFLYSVLEPQLRVEKDKEAFLEYLKRDLIRSFYDDLIVVVTKSSNAGGEGKDCISIDVNELNVEGYNVFVFDENDNPVGASFGGTEIKINRGSTNDFYKIYLAKEEFNLDSVPEFNEGSCFEGEIGLVNEQEYIFKSLIVESINDYNTLGFDSFVSNFDLNVPAGSEFGIIFLNSKREEIIRTNEGDLSVNIFSEEIPIQYVDENAKILSGFIVLRVW